MKLGWIVDRYSVKHELTQNLVEICRTKNLRYDLISSYACRFDPEQGIVWTSAGKSINLREYDILISRSRTTLAQAFISYAESINILTMNSYHATSCVNNKAEMSIALMKNKIPHIPTIITDDLSIIKKLRAQWFPLVLKASSSDEGQGLYIIRHPADLESIHWSNTPTIIQHYMSLSGAELKLYVCGDKVFAVRMPAATNRPSQPEVFQPNDDMKALALRCSELFGLTLCAINVVETGNQYLVSDIHGDPAFLDIPRAAESIVKCVLHSVAQNIKTGERLPASAASAQSSLKTLNSTYLSYLAKEFALSMREMDIMYPLIMGKSNQEIGDLLHITERTVRYHLQGIYGKLGVRRRSEAIACAIGMERSAM